MSETIFNFLKLGGLFLAGVLFLVLMLYVIGLVRTWAEKNKSTKVGARVFDGIEKLKMVALVLSQNTFNALSEESQKALADGKVSNDEIVDAVQEVTKEVIRTLKTEMPALTKYFLGDNAEDFIKKLIKNYIIDYAKEKFGLGNASLKK